MVNGYVGDSFRVGSCIVVVQYICFCKEVDISLVVVCFS